MTEEAKAAEIERLTKLLGIREGRAGYSQNVDAIKAAITKLQEPAPVDG